MKVERRPREVVVKSASVIARPSNLQPLFRRVSRKSGEKVDGTRYNEHE